MAKNSPGSGPVYRPHDEGTDCRGADRNGDWPGSNIGSGSAREVPDRTLPTELDPACMASAMKGLKGIGLNECSMLDSARDFLNQGPALDGNTDSDGEFDNQDLRGIAGRGRD